MGAILISLGIVRAARTCWGGWGGRRPTAPSSLPLADYHDESTTNVDVLQKASCSGRVTEDLRRWMCYRRPAAVDVLPKTAGGGRGVVYYTHSMGRVKNRVKNRVKIV